MLTPRTAGATGGVVPASEAKRTSQASVFGQRKKASQTPFRRALLGFSTAHSRQWSSSSLSPTATTSTEIASVSMTSTCGAGLAPLSRLLLRPNADRVPSRLTSVSSTSLQRKASLIAPLLHNSAAMARPSWSSL